MSQQIDYNKLYFPVKTATPIVGPPTTDSVAYMKKELTKNAKSVTSTLGGAQHGHIFLVLTDADFNAIPGTVPVIRPVHPGPLPQIPVGATAAQISAAERNHQEAVNNFDRYTGVELALLAQVESAIEPIYLSSIINEHTQSLDRSLSEVIAYLAENYKTSDEPMSSREIKINQHFYDPHDPIATIWTLLKNHAEAGERQNVPVTEAWKIDKVLYLLTKTGKFTEDIKEWKKKPQQDKTWVNLVTYFNECHRFMLESNVLTIQDQEREQLTANLASTFQQALALQANSSNTDVASSLAKILRRLQQLESRTTDNDTPNDTRRNPRTRRYTEYCWTHGACNHKSPECRNKAEGHKDEATKNNRMGGSTNFINRLYHKFQIESGADKENKSPNPVANDESNNEAEQKEVQRMKLTKAAARQSARYVFAFVLVYTGPLIEMGTTVAKINNNEVSFWISSLFYPIGGLLNMLVYTRPKVKALKKLLPELPLYGCFFIVVANGGEVPSLADLLSESSSSSSVYVRRDEAPDRREESSIASWIKKFGWDISYSSGEIESEIERIMKFFDQPQVRVDEDEGDGRKEGYIDI
ncbi:hypothetical protein CTEN210_06212 [Chaetoceros tenuissimus]|uniref:Uncharacterized protein n=1 Tax=Chaetoceros tenuissimus TaxID=426638 RepID=A0AAD3CPG1_9STRA|nr:hypothetical protein CTEN210_06212 [Chaetoceros tenuissimus]